MAIGIKVKEDQFTNVFLPGIQKLINNALDKEVDEIIQEAQKKVEEAIRRSVYMGAISLSDYFDIERYGNDVIIKVRIENG